MRLLLSALGGLSVLGGTIAPMIAKSHTAQQTKVQPHRYTRVSLGSRQILSTNQSYKVWEWDFNLDIPAGEKIRSIQFEGGGLRSQAWWGSDYWDRQWNELSVTEGIDFRYILDEEHWDGLAYQWTKASYWLHRGPGNSYSLMFSYQTESFWSFTGSWGSLIIGDALTFVSY